MASRGIENSLRSQRLSGWAKVAVLAPVSIGLLAGCNPAKTDSTETPAPSFISCSSESKFYQIGFGKKLPFSRPDGSVTASGQKSDFGTDVIVIFTPPNKDNKGGSTTYGDTDHAEVKADGSSYFISVVEPKDNSDKRGLIVTGLQCATPSPSISN